MSAKESGGLGREAPTPATHQGEDSFADLVAVMDRLRSPGGCPWDAAQTHATLVQYAVQEVYEVVEAVESGDRRALLEELGDLLLQVVFHARIAGEHPTEPFGIDEVAAGVAEKLRRRHPHVFGDVVVNDATDVHQRWEASKRAEKERGSALDGIPLGMPGLARAQQLVDRAGRAGLPVERAVAVGSVPGPADQAGGIGYRLLVLVMEAAVAGIDAEAALRAAVRELEAALRLGEAAPPARTEPNVP